MAVNDRNRVVDGYLSAEGGVDSGVPPSLAGKNRMSWAVNCTFRDGWPEPRPGWVNRELEFASDENLRSGLQDGYFQGAGTYRSDDGRSYLAASVSGRIFTIDVTDNFRVAEITIPGDPNQVTSPHAWFQQAEGWLVVQNAANPAFLFNGAGSRRAGDKEVPVGGPMAYWKGRLWVARGSEYFGGDLVYSDPAYGRDSVIRFTENDFLNEGGGFAVPEGPITGMSGAANLDTSLGDGDLLVATPVNVHAFNAPIDRTVWKNMEQPLQRYAARSFGSTGHESMVVVNGDVIYRAPDGIRSLQYSRRDFGTWGQTPISRQVHRALRYDTGQWLTEASGVNFDNRLLMTIQPQLDNDHGVWHRGLVSIDYHRVGGLADQLPPVWEGVWTGLRILRVITIEVDRVIRCFIFALSDSGKVQLWEITKADAFDRNDVDNVHIRWLIETRGMTGDKPVNWKRLMGAVQWLDKILGVASLQAYYRADESECWHVWDRWSDCVEYRICTAEVCADDPYAMALPVLPLRPQFRPYVGLTQPPDVPEPQTGGLTRDGFEFQLRFECSGRFRLKRLLILCDELAMPLWGDSRKVTCPPTTEAGSCASGDCLSVACCDRDDYGYLVNSEDQPFPEYPTYPEYVYPETGYPFGPDGGYYPEYDPVYPEWQGGTPDYPEDPDYPTTPPNPDNNPIYYPEQPSDPPPVDPGACDGGTLIEITSNYVWSLTAGQDPEDFLTPEQIACHTALHDIEVADAVAAYETAGYIVTVVSGKKWVWNGSVGVALAMILKPTCDPNDGIGDRYISFSGYTTIVQTICVTTP